MKVKSSQEMIRLGEEFAKELTSPVAIELIGDVGAGKTTFTQGLAKGLGITEEITSPSFTISKRYALPKGGELVHYDFYRLNDVGIMRDELAETLSEEGNIVIVEWAGEVADLLEAGSFRIHFTMLENGAREVEIETPTGEKYEALS